jgi:hypothetical protein
VALGALFSIMVFCKTPRSITLGVAWDVSTVGMVMAFGYGVAHYNNEKPPTDENLALLFEKVHKAVDNERADTTVDELVRQTKRSASS